ncbi:hypothetical protein CDG79_23540 [Nostoc sp. 'Peltigera membranacea cyanobiont' 232]|nr:hypothetical protein CDG79_23540 [Nostoc sp. 'Peltigera membranacea cyanobiont' 232]
MSGKLLVICHCECNELEGSNRKAFGIASLRTLLLRRRYANGNAKGERNDCKYFVQLPSSGEIQLFLDIWDI